jgi:hypothetical protein
LQSRNILISSVSGLKPHRRYAAPPLEGEENLSHLVNLSPPWGVWGSKPVEEIGMGNKARKSRKQIIDVFDSPKGINEIFIFIL